MHKACTRIGATVFNDREAIDLEAIDMLAAPMVSEHVKFSSIWKDRELELQTRANGSRPPSAERMAKGIPGVDTVTKHTILYTDFVLGSVLMCSTTAKLLTWRRSRC